MYPMDNNPNKMISQVISHVIFVRFSISVHLLCTQIYPVTVFVRHVQEARCLSISSGSVCFWLRVALKRSIALWVYRSRPSAKRVCVSVYVYTKRGTLTGMWELVGTRKQFCHSIMYVTVCLNAQHDWWILDPCKENQNLSILVPLNTGILDISNNGILVISNTGILDISNTNILVISKLVFWIFKTLVFWLF